ncbi:hypothetical protein Pmani_028893 [Petrolisthes manimaculis]|uniref:Uncharacterized protein n=1 Tax=Petrolisthes manimaculis TaxID=1843537 RepID=A0AAE1NZ64_9EUCA|nr:hypothetical protein Pmani_028893 [Petrolisthes manimaculis]
MQTSKDPILQKVWSSLVSKDSSNLVENMEVGLEKVLKEPFAMVVEGNYFNFHYSSDCRFFPLPDAFFKYGGGMALAEGSFCSKLTFVQSAHRGPGGEKQNQVPTPECRLPNRRQRCRPHRHAHTDHSLPLSRSDVGGVRSGVGDRDCYP